MSASKRAYEGPDPAQLLLEVWSNHGTDARISEPERVRKGGVFGFFATSVYRVEVDESLPEAETDRSWTLPDLAAPRPAVPAMSPGAPPATPPPRPQAVGDGRSPVTAGLASLLEEADDSFELTPLPTRTFDEVLEEVAGSLGTDPAAFTPPPFAPPPAPPVTWAPLELERFDSIDDLVRRAIGNTVAEDEALGIAVPDAMVDFAAVVPPTEPGHPTAAFLDDAPPRLVERNDPPLVAELATDEPLTDEAVSGVATDPHHLVGRQSRLVAALEAAGYPLELLAPLEGTVLFPTCVEDAFAILGPPPGLPRARGALTAVVAPVGEALRLARALASAHRIDAASVALVTNVKSPTAALRPAEPDTELAAARPADGLVATDLPAIRALSPGWRRDRVGIVAVELDGRGAATRAALRELAPSAVWMAADARSKCEDLAAAVDAIGGADAFMVVHAAQTATPAALLRNAIPVATIDGRRADAIRWARLVRDLAGEA